MGVVQPNRLVLTCSSSEWKSGESAFQHKGEAKSKLRQLLKRRMLKLSLMRDMVDNRKYLKNLMKLS